MFPASDAALPSARPTSRPISGDGLIVFALLLAIVSISLGVVFFALQESSAPRVPVEHIVLRALSPIENI